MASIQLALMLVRFLALPSIVFCRLITGQILAQGLLNKSVAGPENGAAGDDEDERAVAAHGLAHGDIRKVRHLQGSEDDDRPNTPAQHIQPSMTVIIHGTFAKDAEWYQPGGDFHSYVTVGTCVGLRGDRN